MTARRPDPDSFRDAVLARLEGVEPEVPGRPGRQLDRDARRALGAVVCIVVLVGAGALLSRWFEASGPEDAPETAATSIEGAFQRLSIDPAGEGARDGNRGESATEGLDGRYEEVVAAAPGRST
ncbi:MAG: hypothetical protein CMJ54_08845 [Planctomycetaceae bacterium]|nr:hypothetical protein [Planctomycetaceae bacterium]